jgi:hypothetical protein
MTDGAHLSAGRGEGQRWRGWRCLPVREAASGQGATSAWPTGPTGRPSGRGPAGKGGRGSGRLGKENGGGPRLGQKPKLCPIQVINLFNFFLKFEFFWQL